MAPNLQKSFNLMSIPLHNRPLTTRLLNSMGVKRALDFLSSGVLILLCSPLMAIVAIAIKWTSPGSVFFRQTRIGRDGRPFRVYKFRTMVVGAEKMGRGLIVAQDDERITSIGHLLRQTSLDELPQLFNVLRGEMSLIGPRPALPDQVARYTEADRHRLAFRPGITGWAQVNGRNRLSWSERIRLDIWYIDNWSLTLDLAILTRTIRVLATRDGLYGPNGMTTDYGEGGGT